MFIQYGDVRAAVLGLIQKHDDILKSILETVSKAIVKKLVDSPSFLEKLAKNFLKNDDLNNTKQDIYESRGTDNGDTNDAVRNVEKRIVDLERANNELRNDIDTQQQYSRRNCLLLHGVSEEQTDSDKAVLSVCNGKLGLQLTSDCIDRSLRLDHKHNDVSSNAKSRPIIVKLRSYDGSVVFTCDLKLSICVDVNNQNTEVWPRRARTTVRMHPPLHR